VHYMLLIYSSEADWEAKSLNEQAALLDRHDALERDLRESGRYRGCGALGSTETATTVRLGEGKPLITDGPFAETREQLGGYYLVEAKDLEEAIAIAARVPRLASAVVEIRPLQDVRF